MNIYGGKVNVLVGENGAGKSTLMSIFAGLQVPTEGKVLVDGSEVRMRSPRDAGALGIRLIHQELLLFPNLSVAENIFAGNEMGTLGRVDLGSQEHQTAELLAQLGQAISPRTMVGDLAVGAQQMVAICKALSHDVRALIMDEPTSALSAREVEALFSVVRALVDRGVGIIYISHRIDELLDVGDLVTVLRDGRIVGDAVAADVDRGWIIERMIGRKPEEMFAHRPRTLGKPIMEVARLSIPRTTTSPAVREVSFSLAEREIVGIYGLMGAGRTEILQALFGPAHGASGQIRLGGKEVQDLSVTDRIRSGIFLVPEDRQREGLVQELSVKANVSLAHLSAFAAGGVVKPHCEEVAVKRLVGEVGIKVADVGDPVTSLSGGNQQKVVVAKALMTSPKVLLMDDPMRGIDIGAKSDLFSIMQRLAEDGMAILFTSSDIVEVLGMADRVLVMAAGRVVVDLRRDEVTAQALVSAANPLSMASVGA
jgi:erythritol transport system ATP-binding protein